MVLVMLRRMLLFMLLLLVALDSMLPLLRRLPLLPHNSADNLYCVNVCFSSIFSGQTLKQFKNVNGSLIIEFILYGIVLYIRMFSFYHI